MPKRRETNRKMTGLLKLTILSLLVEKPLHGYGIMKKISENTGDAWHPTPGSLYPTLEELVNNNLIDAKTLYVGKRKKIIYNITEKGLEYFLKQAREIRMRITPSLLGFLRSQVKAIRRVGASPMEVMDLIRHVENILEELLRVKMELESIVSKGLGEQG